MVLYPAVPFRSHGHTFRTAIRSSLSVVPKKCKNIFWRILTYQERKRRQLSLHLCWLAEGGFTQCKCTRAHCTHRHTTNLGTCREPLTGLCTHTDFSCFSSLCHAPAMGNVSCRILQAASLNLCLGPYALAGTQAMVPGKTTTQTLPNSPSTDGTLLNSFSCTQDSCLPYPTPATEQSRHIQQASSTSYSGGWTRARGQDTIKRGKIPRS